jgi:hypothetical protein
MGAIHIPYKTIQKITTVKKATKHQVAAHIRPVNLFIRGKHLKSIPNKSLLGISDLVLNDLL